MEFNFSSAPQNRDEYNERQARSTSSFNWSPKSPLGVVILVAIIAAIGGVALFVGMNKKPLVNSGVSEDLKIERVDQTKIEFDKKFKDKTAQLRFGALLYTSDFSGSCEPVVTKATWDRVGGYVTLTRSSGVGCLLTKKTFQQKITPADGSKFPNGTRIVWEKPVG